MTAHLLTPDSGNTGMSVREAASWRDMLRGIWNCIHTLNVFHFRVCLQNCKAKCVLFVFKTWLKLNTGNTVQKTKTHEKRWKQHAGRMCKDGLLREYEKSKITKQMLERDWYRQYTVYHLNTQTRKATVKKCSVNITSSTL